MKKIVSLLIFAAIGNCQDIAYPETEESPSTNDKDERVPLYIPGKCPENQLLFPGDQKDDWICDCAPGFIYYPTNDGCFSPFRQGPCRKGFYLILAKGKVVPECVRNPCSNDGFAPYVHFWYKSGCYEIGKQIEPCSRGQIFGLNYDSMELECVKGKDFVFPINTQL